MKNKITFVRPASAKRTSGISARCPKKNTRGIACLAKEKHAGHCTFKKTPSKIQHASEPKTRVHVSRETKLSCLEMIEDPIYRRKLLEDLRARKLRPAVECLLWYYAKGKPKEMVEHSGTLSLAQELSELTPEQLRQRALDVAKMITAGTKSPAPQSKQPTRIM